MLTCSCAAPDVEFTAIKDISTGIVLLQARCECCGKTASGFGSDIEQALSEVNKKWKRSIRHRPR